jgi:hypothetical protein
MASSDLPWKKLEITGIFLHTLCVFRSLAAVGLEIAMAGFPSYYSVGVTSVGELAE